MLGLQDILGIIVLSLILFLVVGVQYRTGKRLYENLLTTLFQNFVGEFNDCYQIDLPIERKKGIEITTSSYFSRVQICTGTKLYVYEKNNLFGMRVFEGVQPSLERVSRDLLDFPASDDPTWRYCGDRIPYYTPCEDDSIPKNFGFEY